MELVVDTVWAAITAGIKSRRICPPLHNGCEETFCAWLHCPAMREPLKKKEAQSGC